MMEIPKINNSFQPDKDGFCLGPIRKKEEDIQQNMTQQKLKVVKAFAESQTDLLPTEMPLETFKDS